MECIICELDQRKGTTFRIRDARMVFVCQECTFLLIKELYTDTMDIRLRDFAHYVAEALNEVEDEE